MLPWLEISSNAVNAGSILLAARNSVHTWWTGIVGCALFALLFYQSQLYADVLLQAFFIATSLYGWYAWQRGDAGAALEVQRSKPLVLIQSSTAAIAIAGVYGYLLKQFTDAFLPYGDALVLTLSVVAQLLLMRRRYETWWFWLAVNTVSIAIFCRRGLWITAALYCAFWINAWLGRARWHKLLEGRG